MSSYQLTIPSATNRIIDYIKNYGNGSKRQIDYMVEPITVNLAGVYIQQYRVTINYINGVKIFGYLQRLNTESSTWVIVRDSEIDDVVVSFGKLHDFGTDEPYYVSPRDSDPSYIVLRNDINDTVFRVLLWTRTYSTTLYDVYTYEYNPDTNDMVGPISTTWSENNITILSNATIEYTREDETIKQAFNELYRITTIPVSFSKKQTCYRIIKKDTN